MRHTNKTRNNDVKVSHLHHLRGTGKIEDEEVPFALINTNFMNGNRSVNYHKDVKYFQNNSHSSITSLRHPS